MSSSLRATGWISCVADCGGGMSVCCTVVGGGAGNEWPRDAPRYHQLLPISCYLQDCNSISSRQSDSCKLRYNSTRPLLVQCTDWNSTLCQVRCHFFDSNCKFAFTVILCFDADVVSSGCVVCWNKAIVVDTSILISLLFVNERHGWLETKDVTGGSTGNTQWNVCTFCLLYNC